MSRVMVGHKNRIAFLLLYTLIVFFPILISACITYYSSSLFEWEKLYSYFPYLILGVICSFGKAKMRNLVLLFQIGLSTYWLIAVLGALLLYDDIIIFCSVLIISFHFLFCIWYYCYKRFVRKGEVYLSLSFSVLLPLVGLFFGSSYDFSSFICKYIDSIANSILVIVGLFFSFLICLFATKRRVLLMIVVPFIVSLLLSIYLRTWICNYVLYDSFNGEVEKRVSLSFQDRNLKEISLGSFQEKYEVILVWTDFLNLYKETENLQYYYWKYQKSNSVSFYVVTINQSRQPDKADLFQRYDSYHFDVPFYVATDSVAFCKQLRIPKKTEFVCLLRNDTLIYRNTMLKVGEYLDELLGETQSKKLYKRPVN